MRWFFAVAFLVASSCAYVAPPIEVYGPLSTIEQLSGEWWGEYVGDIDHARRGSVSFKLVAGEGHAHGDVLMTPEGRDEAYRRFRRNENDGHEQYFAPRTSILSIRFVFVGDGVVSGALDPYWDPDRGVEASTIFRGTLDGGAMSGTFLTTYANGAASTKGRWNVTRRRPR